MKQAHSRELDQMLAVLFGAPPVMARPESIKKRPAPLARNEVVPEDDLLQFDAASAAPVALLAQAPAPLEELLGASDATAVNQGVQSAPAANTPGSAASTAAATTGVESAAASSGEASAGLSGTTWGLIGGGLAVAAAAGGGGGGGGGGTTTPPTDTTRPTVTITDNVSGTATGDVIYTFTFSESVTGFSASDITVTGGTKGTFSGSGSIYTLTVSPTANSSGTISVDVAASVATDAAGNASFAASTSTQAYNTVIADTTPPTASISDNVTGTATGPITYTFNFSESVTGFTAADVAVSGGTKGTLTGSGSSYSMTVTPPTNSTGSIDVSIPAAAAIDAAGNANTVSSAATQIFDTAAPTVTVTNNVAGTATGDITYAFTFSENVTGFTAAGVTVSTGTKGALIGSGSIYSMTVTPPTNSAGALAVSIPAAAVTDAAGNANIASSITTKNFDTAAPPAVTITHNVAGTASGPITYTFTFSESVTDFTTADVTVSTGTKGALTGSGSSYSMIVTPPANSTGTIDVSIPAAAVIDVAGNTNTSSSTATQIFDTIAPTVTITDDFTGTATSPVTYTFTFSENVTGFTAADVSVSTGTKGALTGSGSSYSMTVTPPANSTGSIAVNILAAAVTDTAGNANTASSTATQVFDTAAPTVTITDNVAGTATGDITYTFTFSESVTGFTAAGVSVSNGTTGALIGSGSIYSMTVTPPTNSTGSITVGVLAAAATDATGNASTVSSTSTQSFDTAVPTVTITDNVAGTATGDITYTFTFSESVTDFTAADVTVSAGTKGALTGSGSIYSMIVTPPIHSVGSIDVSISTAAAIDAAGNVNTAASPSTQTFDTSYTLGQSVIDLGGDGKLIAPVNVDGKWYYYWDRSGDGTSAGVDNTSHDVLDGIFTQDANGAVGGGGNTNDTYRYATLNGVKVALPTANGGLSIRTESTPGSRARVSTTPRQVKLTPRTTTCWRSGTATTVPAQEQA